MRRECGTPKADSGDNLEMISQQNQQLTEKHSPWRLSVAPMMDRAGNVGFKPPAAVSCARGVQCGSFLSAQPTTA
jgi:hypothetical protein